MSIRELVNKAKKGDPAAEHELYRRFRNKMLLICMRFVLNPEDAEERMHDGFCRFFNTLHTYNNQTDEGIFPWLRKIMSFECFRWLKRKKELMLAPIETGVDVPLEEDPTAKLSAKEIFNLIRELPPGYRTVFNLAVVQGLSHNRIALLLGISVGTSRSQLARAKTKMQKILTSKGIEYVTEKK